MSKEETALVPTFGAATEKVPDYIKTNTTKGKENITREDITLPRLALAQALSPELDKSDDKYIPGLEAGDLFNTLTREVFKDGFYAIILRAEAPRWMEFYPRDSKEGSGLKDRDVPAGDPRTEWGPNGEPPVATMFRDYIGIDARTGTPIGISFKGSSLKAAKDLNTFIKLAPGDTYARVYQFTSAGRKNEHGAFSVFKVQPAGFPSKEAYEAAERTFEQFSQANVTIDSADEAADDMAEAADPKADKDVPF